VVKVDGGWRVGIGGLVYCGFKFYKLCFCRFVR